MISVSAAPFQLLEKKAKAFPGRCSIFLQVEGDRQPYPPMMQN
jgi:hypothetical protein